MYSASQTFREKVIDGHSPQNVLMVFDNLFFSANDGDFAERGITWSNYFNTGRDLAFGEAPSDTQSFSIINDNGVLSSFQYGVEQTYFGVLTGVESFSIPSGDNCYIEYEGKTYEGKDDGLYIDGVDSTAVSVPVRGLLGYNGLVYTIGDGASAVVDTSTGIISYYSPNRFIVDKFKYGKSAVFDGSEATVWTPYEIETWEYVPMGVYQVVKPGQNLARVVTITDAHDFMTLFDADAAEFLADIEYPCTIGDIYTDLCDYVGVTYASASFYGSDVSLSDSPFPDTATTLRQVLKWIAEKAFCIAHFDRTGVLELRWVGNSVADDISPNNVAWEQVDIAEYELDPISNVLLKDSSGNTIAFGEGDNPYIVAGNPFITSISAEELSTYRSLPTFTPIAFNVIHPDPSVDGGDIISVQTEEDTRRMLMDSYSRAFASDDDKAYAYEIAPIVVPLMERTLTFTGWLFGRYTARGNKKRLYDLNTTAYNASVSIADKIDKALTPEEVFNKLTDDGRIQGLYMQDGQIYINAEYIKAGVLSGVTINNGSGSFVVDENGNVTAARLRVTGGYIDVETTSTGYVFLRVRHESTFGGEGEEYKSDFDFRITANGVESTLTTTNTVGGVVSVSENKSRLNPQFVDILSTSTVGGTTHEYGLMLDPLNGLQFTQDGAVTKTYPRQ